MRALRRKDKHVRTLGTTYDAGPPVRTRHVVSLYPSVPVRTSPFPWGGYGCV